jgi:hypothetical protein
MSSVVERAGERGDEVGRRVDLGHFGWLRREVADLRMQYAGAEPFPHVVLDDVLPPAVFSAAAAEFPAADDASWTGYLHVNETKYANPRPTTWGPTLRQIAESLCTDEFVDLLGELTGFDRLIADPTMDGGGLHQTLTGGFLNVHADFTTHHHVRTWRRRVNLLLYLNPTWADTWGGQLELWDRNVSQCVRRIEPIGNRLVIFTTSEESYHGHPDPLRSPADIARRSLALYYFTEEHAPLRRSTHYRPRPGDGVKGIAVWLDRHALAGYDAVKTRLGLSDRLVSGVLGRVDRAIDRIRRTR